MKYYSNNTFLTVISCAQICMIISTIKECIGYEYKQEQALKAKNVFSRRYEWQRFYI